MSEQSRLKPAIIFIFFNIESHFNWPLNVRHLTLRTMNIVRQTENEEENKKT